MERVELKVPEARVEVWVGYPSGTRFPCPICQAGCTIYDHQERTWRHLDSCQFQTLIHCRVPRVACPQHGTRQIRVPWAEPGSQFTTLFERLAIDLLQVCPVAGAAAILRISWDEAWGILQRAVRRGQARNRAFWGPSTS